MKQKIIGLICDVSFSMKEHSAALLECECEPESETECTKEYTSVFTAPILLAKI